MADTILQLAPPEPPSPLDDAIARLVLVQEILERVCSETLSDTARRGAALVLSDAIEMLEQECE